MAKSEPDRGTPGVPAGEVWTFSCGCFRQNPVSFLHARVCARGSLARCNRTGGPLKFGFQINSEYFQYKYAPQNI